MSVFPLHRIVETQKDLVTHWVPFTDVALIKNSLNKRLDILFIELLSQTFSQV